MHVIARRLREQGGFTMLVTLGALVLGSLLMVAGFAAAQGDIGLTSNDSSQKDAYYAAQAGISDYVFHLNQDNNYWTYCTSVPPPTAVNLAGTTTAQRTVYGSTTEKYAIELMPANGLPRCDPANANSMITTSGVGAGTFRIRSTGYAGNAKRTIVATFRRPSFLDYVYFTNYETSDPVTYGADAAQAQAQCAQYWRDGRNSQPFAGGQYCNVISFATGDAINGPLHTNDQLAICGSPSFGRGPQDNIEVSAPPLGHSALAGGGCRDQATFPGTYFTNSPVLSPPPSNAELAAIVQPTFHFTGTVYITLNGQNMTVTDSNNAVLYSGLSPGAASGGNGVLYVSNGSCSAAYTPYSVDYTANTGCGNVYVKGNYSSSLTIASENDIIVNGNITHSGDTMLGLIANNFIRVYHPFGPRNPNAYDCGGGSDQPGQLYNLQIDAAMLALQHSFIVDNYDCGATQGTLTINGTIAQQFRGPVATSSGGSIQTGYRKAYGYDDRLRFEEPPHFINPVQSQWRVQRETECSPGAAYPC